MTVTSAGLLIHRHRRGVGREVLLVHPGGPFWARRDLGAWSVPKGELEPGEDPLAAARRELTEELGVAVPPGEAVLLGTRDQSSRKRVTVFAIEGDLDPETIVPGTFPLEWPPRSGRIEQVPEVDRAEWFPMAEARRRLHPGQVPFLDDLLALLDDGELPRGGPGV